MTTNADKALRELTAWQEASSKNYYSTDPYIKKINNWYLEDTSRGSKLNSTAYRFGKVIAQIVGPLAAHYDDEQRRPRLIRIDELGRNVQRIEFDSAHTEAGRCIWQSRVIEYAKQPGSSFEIATLSYLFSQEGEVGHGCPAACTIGAIRVLRRNGCSISQDALKSMASSEYLPEHLGAQFLTEIQGGSDVGANSVKAQRAEDGTYMLYGQKWFCSVAHAGWFVITARVNESQAGTEGLGCFLVPRHTLNGEINGFTIEALKKKAGTRSLPTGVFTFNGAQAYPIGDICNGFKIIVSDVLNTSRWLNAIGSIGMMRRAYEEALRYAEYRKSFDTNIINFTGIQEKLAQIKSEWLSAFHSTWYLTLLDEHVDQGTATDEEKVLYRIFINANKFLTSLKATEAVEKGIEVFGGNGMILDYSVLPRLLEDAKVYELWEGAHDVLAMQVLKDLVNHENYLEILFKNINGILPKTSRNAYIKDLVTRSLREVSALEAKFTLSLINTEHAMLHFRKYLEKLTRLLQVALLISFADKTKDKVSAAIAEYYILNMFESGYETDEDPQYHARILKILGNDLPH